MSKMFSLLLVVLFSLCLSGCNNSSTWQARSVEQELQIIELQTELSTKDELLEDLQLLLDICEENKLFTDYIESTQASFKVEVDYIEINNTNGTISVTVELTAKTNIDWNLGTSTFGGEHLISIEIVNTDDETIFLYSELYDIIITADTFYVHLEESDILTRTLQFAVNPFHGGIGDDSESPEGLYRVKVGLVGLESSWIYTDIVIDVKD